MKLLARAAAATAAATALLVLLAACSTGAPSSGSGGSAASGSAAAIPSLRVGINYTVTTLNPAKNGYQFEIAALTLETLLTLTPQGQLEPELATSVTNPNPVTYVYHLRPGVKFWEGTALTAADVAYSWNFERAASSTGASYFASVKQVTADGPATVVVTLARPDASWPYTPAQEQA